MSEQQRQQPNRVRSAVALLIIHAVAFVLLLVGFVLRLQYAAAEGVHVSPALLAGVAVITVALIVSFSITLTLHRRKALHRAIDALHLDAATVFAYWSSTLNAPFLAKRWPGTNARGFLVAVTADAEGIRAWGLIRRRLVSFGLIPWAVVTTIQAETTKAGVGVPVKGGVLIIRLAKPVEPYREQIALLPTSTESVGAAATLNGRRPVGAQGV